MKYLKLFEEVTKRYLYHGSYTPNLRTLKPYSNKVYSIPPCIFLTDNKEVASQYGDNIYRVEIEYENSKEIEVYGQSFHNYHSFENDIYSAYDEGYDCVIFKNIMDSKEPSDITPLSDVYVLFDSDKVRIV